MIKAQLPLVKERMEKKGKIYFLIAVNKFINGAFYLSSTICY